MADDNQLLYKRDWLNDEEDGGSAYIIVSSNSYSNGSSIDVSVQLKDCSRQLDLDFWFGDEDQRKKKLLKIDLLIERLHDCRKIIAEHPLVPREKDELSSEIITAPGIE